MELEIGKEIDLDLKLEEGKFVLTLKYQGTGLESELVNKFTASYFLDKLAKAIPGELDDQIINGLKKAFGLV